jgi:hypothetical protein
MSRLLLLLLVTAALLSSAGCRRGEMGQSDRRIQSPSLTDPEPMTSSNQDRGWYMQYWP